MPFKAKSSCRHHIARQRSEVTSWRAYDASLRQRGSLRVWFTEEAVAAWRATGLNSPSASDRSEFTAAVSNSQLQTDGNTVDTERYLVIGPSESTHGGSKSLNDGQVTIYDKQTNTYVNVWGDPHLTASDGNQMEFQANGLTIKLDDGTQVEFKPTALSSSGVALIDEVTVTKNNQTVEMSNFYGSAGEAVILSGVQSGSAHDVDSAMGNIHDTVLTAGTDDVGSMSMSSGKVIDSKESQFNLDGLGGGIATYYQNYVGGSGNLAVTISAAQGGVAATQIGSVAAAPSGGSPAAAVAGPSDFDALISSMSAQVASATNMTADQKTVAMNDLNTVLSKLTGAPPLQDNTSWGVSLESIQTSLDNANHIVRPPAFTVADTASGMAAQISAAIDKSSMSASDKTSMKSEVSAVTTMLAAIAPEPSKTVAAAAETVTIVPAVQVSVAPPPVSLSATVPVKA